MVDVTSEPVEATTNAPKRRVEKTTGSRHSTEGRFTVSEPESEGTTVRGVAVSAGSRQSTAGRSTVSESEGTTVRGVAVSVGSRHSTAGRSTVSETKPEATSVP